MKSLISFFVLVGLVAPSVCQTQLTPAPTFTPTSIAQKGTDPTDAPTTTNDDTPAPTYTPTETEPTVAPTTGGSDTPAPTYTPTTGDTDAPTDTPTTGDTSAPTYTPTTGDTAAPTSYPTAYPTYTPTTVSTDAFLRGEFGRNCDIGYEVLDEDTCKLTAQFLQDNELTKHLNAWGGSVTDKEKPRGCFKEMAKSARKIYFNDAPFTKSKVSSGTQGICYEDDQEISNMAIRSKKGRECKGKQGGVAPAHISTANDCSAAAEQYNLNYKAKTVWSNRRPGGCFYKGKTAWFNTKPSKGKGGPYGKYYQLCSAAAPTPTPAPTINR